MQDKITSAINGALNVAANSSTPKPARTIQARITEERIQFLRKLFPKEAGLANAAQRWRYALTDYDIHRASNAVRRYIPEALNLIWIAQDARASRAGQRAFNPIKFPKVVTA